MRFKWDFIIRGLITLNILIYVGMVVRVWAEENQNEQNMEEEADVSIKTLFSKEKMEDIVPGVQKGANEYLERETTKFIETPVEEGGLGYEPDSYSSYMKGNIPGDTPGGSILEFTEGRDKFWGEVAQRENDFTLAGDVALRAEALDQYANFFLNGDGEKKGLKDINQLLQDMVDGNFKDMAEKAKDLNNKLYHLAIKCT